VHCRRISQTQTDGTLPLDIATLTGRGIVFTGFVLVQSEMEKNFFLLVKIPPLRGGDFQGMWIYRAMPVFRSLASAS